MTTSAPPYAGLVVFYQGETGEVPAMVAKVYPWTVGRPIPCDMFIMDGSGLGTAIPSDESATPAVGTWHSAPNTVNPYGPVTTGSVVVVPVGPLVMASGNLYTTKGSLVEVELLLPSPVWAGMICSVYLPNANGVLVRAQAGATIQIGGAGPGATAESFAQGSYLDLEAVSGSEWVGAPGSGSWDVE